MADTGWPISTTTASYIVVVAFVVVVAAVLGPVAWNAGSNVGDDDPSVAVITLRGGTTDANINRVTEDLREARTDSSVEAVVLRIDSPGGPVDSSEEFYLAMNRTAAEMPVVAYVEGSAASGGYYGIAPADEIYVKPSSTVGSIGVVVQVPLGAIEQAERQTEGFVRSGPDKAQIDRDRIRENLVQLRRSFVGTVMEHRGDELTMDRDEVANGKVYLGSDAVQNGFADEVGDLDAAIEAAAAQSDEIEGDQYDVDYVEQPSVDLSALFGGEVETVSSDGEVVYVVTEDTQSEFVQPVEYYAVWGVPAVDDAQQNTTVATEEVVADD